MKEKESLLDMMLPLLEEGKTMEISPRGTSMFPLFTEGRDQAILAAADTKKLQKGDVVLYRRDSGMLVIHRICRITQDGFYMVGDNQVEVEGPLRPDQIKALMVSFRRKGKLVSCKNPIYIFLSRT